MRLLTVFFDNGKTLEIQVSEQLTAKSFLSQLQSTVGYALVENNSGEAICFLSEEVDQFTIKLI